MIGALLLAVAAASAMAYSQSHYSVWSFGMPGSGLMPLAGGIIVVLSCLAIAIKERRKAFILGVSRVPAAYATGFFLLVPVADAIGLLPALAVLSVILLSYVERMPFWRSAIVAVVVSCGSWLLFERLLLVPLPQGWIWSL
ncbi:hypothetical protein J2046_003854 [Rhizobium petrolearium]|uniref:tripartite tricarboxylate transporter TctB family protein n=1 Tax=Neorhizobium petrolearium TaxID=515361 RepID=UPI001AE10445|nr:tripartite tricarboxylate transporter TctB family protein [Neorhizobium petrolearium]MBP1845581.1 hypothetical protein [Neorhizobium petrolearium]